MIYEKEEEELSFQGSEIARRAKPRPNWLAVEKCVNDSAGF